jgi:hypothetical protein
MLEQLATQDCRIQSDSRDAFVLAVLVLTALPLAVLALTAFTLTVFLSAIVAFAVFTLRVFALAVLGVVEPPGGRMCGGGSCPSYLSMMLSYFAPSWRCAGDMVRQPGAVRRTRGECAPHSGQSDGRSHSAIARIRVNGPHLLHIYSYVGIDHPAKNPSCADQSVAIMKVISVDA